MKLSENNKESIITSYKNGAKVSVLAKQYNIHTSTVNNLLNSNFVERRCRHSEIRKYLCNFDYFKNIDTEEKAYWLGFIFGDGCISGNNFTFQLNVRDKSHLEKFKQSINSNHPIKNKIVRKTIKGIVKKYYHSLLLISSKDFTKNLKDKGIVENKTYFGNFPNIDSSLFCHFIRGYFDADGWLIEYHKDRKKHQYGFGIVAYQKIVIESVQKWLYKNNISSSIYRKKKGQIELAIKGNNNYRKFVSIVYNNPSLFLDRKYKKINEINHFLKSK